MHAKCLLTLIRCFISCFTVSWAGLLESPLLSIMQRFDCYRISPYYFQLGPTVCRSQSVQLVFSFTMNPQWKLTLHRNELIKLTVNPKSPFNSVTALPKSVFISILFSWKGLTLHRNEVILRGHKSFMNVGPVMLKQPSRSLSFS